MASYWKYFHRAIRRNYPAQAEAIISAVEEEFKVISVDIKFAATSKNPIDRRLDFCGCFLALIKTLDRRGENYETVRRISLEVVTEYVKPRNKLHAMAKRIPSKVIKTWWAQRLVRIFARKVGSNENKEGFIANIITDKEKTFGLGYGVDIIECGICKLFNKHNYSKYSPLLCEVDELTSGLAGLKLIRNGTIANGAKICDFRWQIAPTRK